MQILSYLYAKEGSGGKAVITESNCTRKRTNNIRPYLHWRYKTGWLNLLPGIVKVT